MALKPYIIEVLVGLSRSHSKHPPRTTDEYLAIQEEVQAKLMVHYPWLDCANRVIARCIFGTVLCTARRVHLRMLVEAKRPLEEVVIPDGENLVFYQTDGEIFVSDLDVYWVSKTIARIADGQFVYERLQNLDGEETGSDFRFYFMPEILTAVEERVGRLVAVEDVAIHFADEIDSAVMKFFRDKDLLAVNHDDLDEAAATVAEQLGHLIGRG